MRRQKFIARRTCIALYSSELIRRKVAVVRDRVAQFCESCVILARWKSVLREGRFHFPPCHPRRPARRTMRGPPVPLISESDPRGANSGEERRDEYGYKWEDTADATPERRPAMKDVGALNEKCRRRLPGRGGRMSKGALSSKRSIPHPRYRTLTSRRAVSSCNTLDLLSSLKGTSRRSWLCANKIVYD